MLSVHYWLGPAFEAITKIAYALLHSLSLLTLKVPNNIRCSLPAPPSDVRYSLAFGETRSVPFRTVSAAFEHFAEKYPANIAVEHAGSSISYGELLSQSTALAAHLRSRGVTHGHRICLLVERGIPMIIATLATLKAGASYIPLDGGIVTDLTLSSILDDARPALILCSRKYMSRTQSLSTPTMELENEIAQLPTYEKAGLHDWRPSASDEAYVIYTSGTTGKPKGVQITHGNLSNLVCTSPGNLGIRPGMRVGHMLNIAFDMGVWETFSALANGGTLCLRSSGRGGSSCEQFEKVFKASNVIICTPTILQEFNPSNYPSLRTVATAGERCPQQLADRWVQAGKRFFNSCGPTEVTIVNTMFEHQAGVPISIGRPTPNNSVYVLDEHLKPLPTGVPGTLWAGGAGTSSGYINLPELTASRFLLDPFVDSEKARMYNTGDIGYMDDEGYIYHLGRVDDQVKVKGFRVELDGISTSLTSVEGVSSGTVLLVENELWAIYTTSGHGPSKEQIKDCIKRLQPYYAVPSQYLCIPDMPKTSNGKIDKAALRTRISQLSQ